MRIAIPCKTEAILIHSLFPDIFHFTLCQEKNQDVKILYLCIDSYVVM